MLLSDALCYAILTITLAATCVGGENPSQELTERKPDKKISKREAAILIDSYPLESSYKTNPGVIYRRVSKQRYRRPKPKYGPPSTKYGPPQIKFKTSRKPVKKYRAKYVSAKYGPPVKKRVPKPRYGPPKKPTKYGPPKKQPHFSSYSKPTEPVGFGEPPKDYTSEYVQPPKQTYGEPPVDSYGVPLRPTDEPYPTAQDYTQNNGNYDSQNNQQYQSWQSYQQDQQIDNINSYSKHHPIFSKPELFGNMPKYADDDNLESYADVYKHSKFKGHGFSYRKKPLYIPEEGKEINRPWGKENGDTDDHIVVGGQYAEPPARYVAKFQPSAPMYTGDEEFAPPHGFLDSDVAASATVSPYVNYKNSNMAFSPQNLNDAFSIPDK